MALKGFLNKISKSTFFNIETIRNKDYTIDIKKIVD